MITIGRRIVGAVPVLLGISFIVFMLMHLAPGDPVVLLLGDDATPADVARVRQEWGLDQPLLVQYWQFISRALVGDFGKSLKFGEPVLKLISERLPATVEHLDQILLQRQLLLGRGLLDQLCELAVRQCG